MKSADSSDFSSKGSDLAVVAHPYAPLNGSLHDRIVQLLARSLTSRGVQVLLYNSRGAGKSAGRTSWTGEPERRDFEQVVAWFLNREIGDIDHDDVSASKEVTMFCCVSTR